MSIYATLWQLQFPHDGYVFKDTTWVAVLGQGVPSHIGTPTPGHGYERGDPYAAFLPPAIADDPSGRRLRAVVIVVSGTPKGTLRSGQEYASPLLVLTGDEYAVSSFHQLHERVCDALRERARVAVAEDCSLEDGATLRIYANGDARVIGRPDPP